MLNLEKNSEMMKTVVEMFFVEEVAPLIYDNEQLERWKELNEKLGMSQAKLAKEDKSPIPFMYLNETMLNVFKTLCPREYQYKDFDLTPIPLEILEGINLGVTEKYFDAVEIWADEKNPDPIAIGITAGEWYARKQDGYTNWDRTYPTKEEAKQVMIEREILTREPYYSSSTSKKYLIGKWADVKQSFDELKLMAFQRYTTEEKTNIQSDIKALQTRLEDVDLLGRQRFGL